MNEWRKKIEPWQIDFLSLSGSFFWCNHGTLWTFSGSIFYFLTSGVIFLEWKYSSRKYRLECRFSRLHRRVLYGIYQVTGIVYILKIILICNIPQRCSTHTSSLFSRFRTIFWIFQNQPWYINSFIRQFKINTFNIFLIWLPFFNGIMPVFLWMFSHFTIVDIGI